MAKSVAEAGEKAEAAAAGRTCNSMATSVLTIMDYLK